MKKTLTLSLLLLSSTMAQADIAGAKAGLEYWRTSDHDNAGSAYVQIEHPIPLVPNFAARGTTVEGKVNSLNSIDLYGYYEVLDNSLTSIDLGVGLHHANGFFNNDHTLAMAVVEAEWLPDSQVSYYTRLNYALNADDTVSDFGAGVRIQLFPAVYLQAGYRYYDIRADNNGVQSDEVKGFTAGVHIDI